MKTRFILMPAVALLLASCGANDRIDITVSNSEYGGSIAQTASTPAPPLMQRLGAQYVYVVDADGTEVPSQITADSMLIFSVDIPAGGSAAFSVLSSDTMHVYAPVATGRLYPERADDLAWENDVAGFRAYGPATQRKGERAFGYDIFFKHHSDEPMLPVLYRDETDPAVWARVDSLRAIDPRLADEYIDSFSYHIDHGLGMDCYAVGPTLGDGVAAFVDGDTIYYAWCYDTAEVIDNGPVRFTARLDFSPRAVKGDSAVVEHRIISLDKGMHLNRQKTWFEGRSDTLLIGAGMPMRDGCEVLTGEDYTVVTDLTQGSDNGKALLGVLMPYGKSGFTSDGHSIVVKFLAPADTLEHWWGFAWDRQTIQSPDRWAGYMEEASKAAYHPVEVIVK